MQYTVLLGKNKTLSALELTTQYGDTVVSDTHALIESSEELTQSSLDSLGGSINIGRYIGKRDSIEGLITMCSEEIMQSMLQGKKVIFGMNIYPLSQKNKKNLKSLLIGIKKYLTSQELKSRFMNKVLPDGASNLQHIQVKKELLEVAGTCCIELIETEKSGTYICSRIIASQDIEKYSKRDYDRPFRDAYNGMMPPKLCQILINLAQGNDHKTIITDPFCGNGGILIEGLMMGKSVQGSDIDERMVEETKNNLDWLRTEFGIPEKCTSEVVVHDARSALPFKGNLIIATEGYLGPPIKMYPHQDTLQQNLSELQELYMDFFTSLASHSGNIRMAIALPCYLNPRTKEMYKRLERADTLGLNDAIRRLGFELLYDPIIYAREDQLVGREISVWEKQSSRRSR